MGSAKDGDIPGTAHLTRLTREVGDEVYGEFVRVLATCCEAVRQIRQRMQSPAEPATESSPALREALEQVRADLAEERALRERAEASLRQRDAERSALRELRLEVAPLRSRALEADHLAQELQEVRERLELLGSSVDDLQDVEALRRRERAVIIRTELLHQRVAELEHHADENVRLREQLWELEALRLQVGEMEGTIRALEGRLLSGGAPRSDAPLGGAPWSAPLEAGDTMAATVESELQTLVDRTESRSAVIADRRGLPIAEAGAPDHRDELAALASLAQGLTNQARSLLPLGPVVSVELWDTSYQGTHIRLFVVDEEDMGLVLLGSRRVRVDEALDSSVPRLSDILAERKWHEE